MNLLANPTEDNSFYCFAREEDTEGSCPENCLPRSGQWFKGGAAGKIRECAGPVLH